MAETVNDTARIAVVHPDPKDQWLADRLGRMAVIRPAGHRKGVDLWWEKKRDDFDGDVARLADILGLPVVEEYQAGCHTRRVP